MSFLAKNMLYLRKKAGKNQSQLAFEVQVRPNTISNWENKASEPNATHLLKICQIFNISPNQLLIIDLEDTESPDNSPQNPDTQKSSQQGDLQGEKNEIATPLHLVKEDNEPYGKPLLDAILKMSDNIEQMRVVMEERLPEKPKKNNG